MFKLGYLLALIVSLCVLQKTNAIVAGLDFGGEFFKIALVKPGRPFEIVTNIHSKRKTETIVAFDGEERFYGTDAKNIEVRRPQNAYSQVRKLLGAHTAHPEVVAMTKQEYLPYELIHNDTRGNIGLKHSDEVVFNAEELNAMIFTHAKDITNAFAEASVKDWVITVPMYFTEAQRQAVIDSAEIAGLRVLSLIEENTAAALHHAISMTPPTTPERVLFYNMGSTSVQVSVVEYTSRVVPDGFKKNKTLIDFEVIGKAWDENLGGSQFDLLLADQFATEFNKKLGKNEDVRSIPRSFAKLRAAARKTKIVLSANEEIPTFVPGLYKDIDFKTLNTRAGFEELCKDLFDRVLPPIDRALKMAGATIDEMKDLEIIGGGVRVPKVQQLLKSYVNRDLSQHLNGDEAMALGAAFHAANLSTSFRVRQIGIADLTSFPIGVRITDLHHVDESKLGDSTESNEEHWVKRASLFNEMQKTNVKKSVAFSHDKDLSCVFRYDKPSALPKGASALISRYNITGVESFAAKMKDKNLGEPKVTLTFHLDASSMAHIVKAEATLDEEIEVPKPVKKASKRADDKKDATGDDDSKTDSSASGDDKPSTDKEGEDSKEEVEMIKKTKTHRHALHVVRTDHVYHLEANMGILPMSLQHKVESKELLTAMNNADKLRKLNAEAKNHLESFVYESRDTLSSNEDDIALVTTPEQVEKLKQDIDNAEEWLYDESEFVEAKVYRAKLAELETQLNDILFRVSEKKALPDAVEKAEQYAISTKDLLTQWSDNKPQVTEDEKQGVLDKITEMIEWTHEKVKAQKAHPIHEKPVVASGEVLKRIQTIKKAVVTLSKKPQPVAPKSSSNDTKDSNDTKEANESAAEDTMENTSTESDNENEKEDANKEDKVKEDPPHEEL